MKHLLSITDLSRGDVEEVFRLAAESKAAYVPATELEHPLIAEMSRPLDTVA